MKQQIQLGKQHLISRIEDELSILRQKRNHLQVSRKSDVIPNKRNLQLTEKEKLLHHHEMAETKNNIKQLQYLYNCKRELGKAGITVNHPSQIRKYTSDEKMLKMVQKKKAKMQAEEEKRKIVEEEMMNTKKLLKKRQVNTRQRKELQEYWYKNFFQKKKKQLETYERLLKGKNLNRIQKQQLIEMTFNFLKEWNGYCKKDKIKNFLLVNEEFCRIFQITYDEIVRDLDVFSTKQAGFLDYNEFYQYIKSIEITNKSLKPTSGFQKRIEGYTKEAESQEEKQLKKEKREKRQLILEYLKRIFSIIDKKKEGIILREKFIIAIDKKMTLKEESKVKIGKLLEQYSMFLKENTNIKMKKSYYKQLQISYINLSQIQNKLKEFINQKYASKPTTDDLQSETQNQKSQLENEEKEEKYQVFQKQPEIIMDNQPATEDDFEKYGWKDDDQPVEQIKLKNLDQYYSQLRNKHANEIEWEGFDHYKADFKKLQAYIHEQEKKLEEEK